MITKHLNPLYWKKSFLIGLLAGFFILWFTFFDTYSLSTRYQLETQKKNLVERTQELEKKSDELKQKISTLEDNPDLLEKIAREEYGMRKPGETVYRIKPAE
ncbi:septum formation initiator family protein [Rhodohalobacter sp. SW132]|uniref:FtsB family cell division protein n=1 Tax=Rhodohalobacter sp. SW132 TaxID=2293433 RepID=UPI000E24014E|nr:septum formation initiator family protein [Rhodohalobacter sp. SW132]REL39230.1 septum formation initiator family protein [Rhodohalobacter sp. SW132]